MPHLRRPGLIAGLVALLLVIAASAVVAQQTLAPSTLALMFGWTTNGAKALPLAVATDADGQRGHLVVDAGSGFPQQGTNGVTNVSTGGSIATVLTSGSATSCTSITAAPGRLVKVLNASTSAQTQTIALFNEGTSPTCASGNQVYSVVLGASQVVTLDIPMSNGIAYTLTGAATNNIVVTRF